MHDASYYGIIELKGPEGVLWNLLSILCHCSPARYRTGARVCKVETRDLAGSACGSSPDGQDPREMKEKEKEGVLGAVIMLWQSAVCEPAPASLASETDGKPDKVKKQQQQKGEAQKQSAIQCTVWIHPLRSRIPFHSKSSIRSSCSRISKRSGSSS